MNLNELLGTYKFEPGETSAVGNYYKKREWDAKNERYTKTALQGLKDMGWKPVGYGAFSTVYENPSKNYIMKINDHYDEAFAWFVLLTKKYPNPHFPKIGAAKAYRFGKEKYYIYLIEKLYPIDVNKLEYVIDDFSWVAKHPNTPIDELIQYPEALKFFRSKPKLLEALYLCGRFGLSKGYKIDVHRNNVMKRQNGQLVIIDPFADKNQLNNIVAMKYSGNVEGSGDMSSFGDGSI